MKTISTVSRLAAVTALTTGMLAGTGSAAQAGPDRLERGGTVTLRPGEALTIPTWVFGKTEVCALSGGDGPGKLRVRSQSGADPEFIEVQWLLHKKCIQRWWGGVPLDLANDGATVLSVSYR